MESGLPKIGVSETRTIFDCASDLAAYTAAFSKVYNGDEASSRERIDNANIAECEPHNADATQTYTKGVNQFSDLTLEEFRALPIRGYMAAAK